MNSQVQPLVSVVTPVYNGAKYLVECIESVLAQSYQNWEYVIVDNCSTDQSSEVAQSYAEKDPRIRVYRNQQLASMAENHNIALRLVSPESKYCKIVHADDWIFPECIAEMVKVAEGNPSVGVVGAYGLEGVRVVWDGLPYPSTVVPGHDLCRRSFLSKGFYVFGSPTSILFRSDLVRKRKAFFNGHPFHAQFMDIEACYEVLQNYDFGFVHQVLTFSRTHDESASASYGRTGFNTDLPAQLNILRKYGPKCLTEQEYQGRVKRLMGKYYRFMGWKIFQFRKKGFRNYHRSALNHMGYSFSLLKLAKGLFLELLDVFLTPKRIAVRILKLVRR